MFMIFLNKNISNIIAQHLQIALKREYDMNL